MKIITELTDKINTLLEKYEKNFREKLKKMENDLNENSENNFNQILDAIKENNDALKKNCEKNFKYTLQNISKIIQEIELNKNIVLNRNENKLSDNSEIKEQGNNINQYDNKSVEYLNKFYGSKKDIEKYYNLGKKDNPKEIKRKKNTNENIRTNQKEINNSNNIKAGLYNNKEFIEQNNSKTYYHSGAKKQNNNENKQNNRTNTNNSNISINNSSNNSQNNKQYKNELNKDYNLIQNMEENEIDNENSFNINSGNKNSFNISTKQNKNIKQNNNNYSIFNKKNNQKAIKTNINMKNENNIKNLNKNSINGKNYKEKKENEKNDNEKKPIRNILSLANNIFFIDNGQNYPKKEKINDMKINEIIRELEREIKNNDKTLIEYFPIFIESNVLKHFKRRDLNDEQREILKYNIKTILKICGINPTKYSEYYYPEVNNKRRSIDRNMSIEALKKFRKEYGISKEEFSDEGLIRRLNDNNLDIRKTFEKMFG